ncbi:dethiobiotin synthase [uncultured Thiocystis sp.]|jgi:dethiobiotin synthetase|uniref:dethiobiotin synthase n=1 Tax=uncultured Thiocystis sp. TaxID=1202134 RepID=UPI0025F87690|nr:dethiobiotin synthase [uncultured Thiocystis sp.]
MSGVFVTGTDTGCGKTAISVGLMAALQSRGLRVLGMKPVASGCALTPSGLRNEDALTLQEQGSSREPYERINPYAFAPPIAPHLAATAAGVAIDLAAIVRAYGALDAKANLVVVEGVGGWRVPLGPDFSLSDLPAALELPVILVVGLKLGCLNHALLTAESIQSSDTRLIGWIGNQIDPEMLVLDANLATLANLIEAPCLGVVPWLDHPEPAQVAGYLREAARAGSLSWVG